jgi:hypothetical protein
MVVVGIGGVAVVAAYDDHGTSTTDTTTTTNSNTSDSNGSSSGSTSSGFSQFGSVTNQQQSSPQGTSGGS